MKNKSVFLLAITLGFFSQLIAQTNYTSSITNPGFETGDAGGWKWTGADGYEWLGPNTDGDATKDGDYINGLWNSSIGDAEFSQSISALPEGYYKVTALVTVSANRLTNQRIFAESDGETVSMLYGAEDHAAYTTENLSILGGTENYSFGGFGES